MTTTGIGSRGRGSLRPADDYQTLYTWDNRDRLTSVTFKDNAGDVTKTVTYIYDVFNRWIGETVSVSGQVAAADAVRLRRQPDRAGVRRDGHGRSGGRRSNPPLSLGSGQDQLLADEAVSSLTAPGTVLWPLADQEGTIRDLASYNSQTGTTTIANHRVYDSYGALVSQTDAAVNCLFGYTGAAL